MKSFVGLCVIVFFVLSVPVQATEEVLVTGSAPVEISAVEKTHTPTAEITALKEAAPPPPAPPDYIIGNGDLLDICLWKDEALTRQVVVLPDGKISFPLVGQVNAAGRTVSELKKEMSERLLKYVSVPDLHIEVKQVNSLVIYIIGKVNNPGRFLLNTNVTVLQALAIAGGLNIYANKSKIKIFRQEGSTPSILDFDYDKAAEAKKPEQNILLKRGDLIIVP